MGTIGPALANTPPMTRASSEALPTVDEDGGTLQVGQELITEDTGNWLYWTGSRWEAVLVEQKLAQMCEFLRDIRTALVKED